MMINGICTLLARQPFVAQVSHLQGFVNVGILIIFFGFQKLKFIPKYSH